MRRRLVLACTLAVALVVVATAASGGFKQAPGAPIPLGASADPLQIQTGDINGDGKLDLAVLDYDSDGNGQIAVYFGAGPGKFTKGPVSPVGTVDQGPDAFALGDVNGDHHLDVVVTEYSDIAIATYLGDGKGHFTLHGSEAPLGGGSQPDGATIADLNGDHVADLVVPNGFVAGLDFLEGDGTGAFTSFSGSPINYENDIGPGNYVDGPATSVVADFDGDHVPDALVLDYYNPGPSYSSYGTMQLFHGDGVGGLSIETTVDLPGVPGWFASGDFNGDGITDVVVSFPALNEVQVFLGNGDGTFAAQTPATTPDPTDVVVGDFNGDKRLDVGTIDGAVTDGAVDVALGDGQGNLSAEPGGPFAINAGTAPELDWMDAGDVSGDHKTDLLAINDQPGAIDVLVTQGGALASGTVSPASGIATSTVTIKGANLSTVAFVQFGGGVDGTITSQSATQLKVDVPSGASQGKLTLIGANGASMTATLFTPIAAPVISSLSPLPGTKAGATETINGQHFTGTSSVTFGGVAAKSFKVVSDSKLTAVVPVGAGTPITVTNAIDHASTPFVLITAPHIDSFSPTDGAANAIETTTVHLSGSDLEGVTSVTFGGVAAKPSTISISVDGESLQVDAPPTAKTGPIVVKNVAGSYSTALNTDPNKTFTVDAPPLIKSLSATTGTTGDTITITGTNLIGITEVDFAGVPGSSLSTAGAPTSISVHVPAHAGIGKVTAVGTYGTATSAQVFTPHIAPILTAFAPSIGALPAATITISGFHFTGTKSVTFAAGGGSVSATFKAVSDTSLSVKIPVTAVSGMVNVTNAYGTTGAAYYVIQTPVLASTGAFSPTAGTTTTPVIITGEHLGGTTSVTFNGHATTFTLDSDTQITAHPSASNQSGVVSVTNAAGTATTTDAYTVVIVSGFSPSSGGIGQVVTITGNGLTAVTGVTLPGQGETDPSNVSDTSFTVTVQSCATTTTGKIVVWVGSIQIQTASSFALTSNGPC